ncbi:Ribosomal protein 50S-L18Ae/60S-L20/60S-L18A [Dillenia turbinata]|uniref:Ribosomal protein 50S-L18Ae/60S-L20/60S-L18A n=1 Tax=Dillenia turbinata TaxID=194707 RepID=A0AAN8UTB0_9MAGN
MSSEEEKNRGVGGGISYGEPQQYHYGTFQGVANYYPPPPTSQHQPPPAVGFPQPAPPPGAPYYSHGSQTLHGYAFAEGTPIRERRLPCCGLGIGWFLFLIGFIFGAIPWYIGAFMLMCARVDYREKPGLIACMIAVSIHLVLAPFVFLELSCRAFDAVALYTEWDHVVCSCHDRRYSWCDEGEAYVVRSKKTAKMVFHLGFLRCLFRWWQFHQYQVVGRALPTESDEHPKIYRMKLWATNEVRAKSKFWYFLRKLKKVKKSNGQVLAINEIFEKNPTKIKNYGIWLRYQSRTGYHNMYKEYRDTTLNGAVEQMYNEMASRHRVRFPCIQIIKTATIPAKLCKRESTKQFHNSKIKFPLVFKKVRPPNRKLKTTYKASKPNLFV